MALKFTAIASGIVIYATAAVGYAAEPAKPWKGEAELGAVKTSGNSETQSITARGNVTYERAHWRHTVKLAALNTSDETRTTAERYQLTGKSDYKLDAVSYVFGMLDYENDRFAGFEYRTTEAVGYGRRVLERNNLTLDLEAGPGARQTNFQNGDSQNELIGRLAGLLAWKISDTATFTEDLGIDIGEEATITKSVTALKAQVANSLAMKVSYALRNISDVPAGIEKTDTEAAVTLVYGF